MTNILQNALYSIPAEDRETWVAVGMAIHAELGDAGFEMWDAWSRQAASYKAADAKSVWRGFKREGGIRIGTLYHLAGARLAGRGPGLSPGGPRGETPAGGTGPQGSPGTGTGGAAGGPSRPGVAGTGRVRPHPYLVSKGFPEAQGLIIAKENLLLVPMRSLQTGAVQSLQTITADGAKKFLAGGRAKGAVYNLGRAWTRWYVEGYATGLSVQAALKRMYRQDQVVVCFSAGNLAHVATPSTSSPPQGFVVADHDARGTGEKYARKTGLPYWMPSEFGDANDFHQAHGIDALANELRRMR